MRPLSSVLRVFSLSLLALILNGSPPVQAADISHLGIDQRVLVICVTWNDHATTRLGSCADWVTLLNNQIDNFYDQATHGQTTFIFEGPVGAPDNGWLALGYDSTDYEYGKTGQDAINLADPYVDFSNIHRVAVITNHPNFGGQGSAGWWWATDEGTEHTFVEGGVDVEKRFMSLSIVNEWLANSFSLPYDEAAAVVAHELGHHLDVKTHYGTIGWFPGGPRDVITPWDVMGLSPFRNHFHGWAKLERQWTPAAGVQTVMPPDTADVDTTITLSASETAGGTDLIRIPITDGPVFTGYTVENRRLINGDENLPQAGVLISFVDENPNTIRKAIVLDDPGSPGDLNQAALEVGDSYTDAARNLTITYVSQSGDDADVRIQYLLPPALPPNPQITPWGSPPWETVDIWLDSEKNGWGTYRYTDGSGNPVGNGDDAWVDHDNRVYFRVSNGGTGIASNVHVQVYANEPPGMGDSGADWRYLGSAVFTSIAAGGNEVGYVTWRPTVGHHTCLKVVILDTDEETTSLDNIAQENVTAFDTSDGSPYKARCQRFTVNNPFEYRATPVHMLVRDIPENWIIQVEPTDFVLKPGESEQVCMTVFPPEPDEVNKPGFIGKPKIEAQVPFANTFIPIGGIDVWTHLTTDTRLTCDSNGTDRLETKPEGNPDSISAGLAPKSPTVDPARPALDAKALDNLFRESALIKPEIEPIEVGLGEPIKAEGSLQPGFSGATVAVDFITRDTRETLLVTTDPAGKWRAEFNPATGGLWEVKAYYAGDLMHATAESNRCRYQVERKEASEACECDPAMSKLAHWLALAAALIAIVLFYMALRERICRNAMIAALILAFVALIGLSVCLQTHLAPASALLLLSLAILVWWYRVCNRKLAEMR
ncbi:MAG: hypothetical protein MI756_12320 [Chromatiales bacterium]|nr:hypothetical protein [Chromatiales bacterium]